ncbi:MAG: ECF transporter S component [Clostridia bacterium]|nr:ECF transporter S component [Clostridia bacterium]
MSNRRLTTLHITTIAILSSIAAILMHLDFPIPLMPPFLKIDFSEVPVLLATFAMGPLSGIFVELIKNLLNLLATETAGVGEFANFFVGIAFVIPAGLMYKRNKSRNGALLAMSAGVLSMTVFASVFNYFVLLPMYSAVLHFPTEAIVGMGKEVNKYIVDVKSLIALGIAPFNIFKGVVVSVLVLIMYKKVSPLLHKTAKQLEM